MKFAGSYLIAGALLFVSSTQAQDVATAGSADIVDRPYATIVARNMFGLLPIPPPDTNPPAPPVDPPPKITLNGIMTIFGRDQALYKVATKPKPGQPAKEDSYVLGENERQDDIEVVKINRESNVVTFNNHGTQQEVQLAEASSSGSAPGPGGGGPGNAMPANLRPGAISAAERAALFRKGAGTGNPPPASSPGNFNNNGNVPSFNSASSGSSYAPNQQQNGNESLTPEQKVILIEAQRMKYMQEGNPMANLLPPTPLTQQNVDSQRGASGSVGGGLPSP